MRHALLVVSPEGRQRIADAGQRLANAGDVAVAEDRPDAGEEGNLRGAYLDELAGEIADERLGRRQPDLRNPAHRRHASICRSNFWRSSGSALRNSASAAGVDPNATRAAAPRLWMTSAMSSGE